MMNNKENNQMTKPIVFIQEDAWRKMWGYIKGANTEEISGFGYVEKNLLVSKLYDLWEQECSAATTSIKQAYVSKFLREAGPDFKGANLWWHSHGNGSTFWSGTDEDTIKEFRNIPWMVHIVGNIHMEYKCKLVLYEPVKLEIECDIMPLLDIEVTQDIKDEIKDKVTIPSYSYDTGFRYNNKSYGRDRNTHFGMEQCIYCSKWFPKNKMMAPYYYACEECYYREELSRNYDKDNVFGDEDIIPKPVPKKSKHVVKTNDKKEIKDEF